MKIVIIVTAGLVAMLSVAAAADLPRKDVARGPSTPSFDHLVGAGEQGWL
jgi:hypothetical protein